MLLKAPIDKEKWNLEYKNDKWKELSKHIKERDNNQCTNCKSKKNLHCHHDLYLNNKPIWEVPLEFLRTLCSKCHVRFHEEYPAYTLFKQSLPIGINYTYLFKTKKYVSKDDWIKSLIMRAFVVKQRIKELDIKMTHNEAKFYRQLKRWNSENTYLLNKNDPYFIYSVNICGLQKCTKDEKKKYVSAYVNTKFKTNIDFSKFNYGEYFNKLVRENKLQTNAT